jgi:thiamine-phosphate pyrophosphorylase
MKALIDCPLYGILDLSYVDILDWRRVASAMIEGGVDVIQLRGKTQTREQLTEIAVKLHTITNRADIPLIINDHALVAQSVLLEGVHVGQDDDPVAVARQKAGRALLVGKSTHSFEQALAAQHDGADYIGFGPVFATPTKPDYLPIGLKEINRVRAAVSLPIFCIGGIKIENLEQVIAAGARRVAIVSGLLKAPDIIEYARACKKLLTFDL